RNSLRRGGGEVGDEFAVMAMPHPENAFLATGDDPLAIGSGCGGVHEVGGTVEGADLVSVLLEDANLVVAGGGEGLIGDADERDGGDFLAGALDVLLSISGGEVPDFDDIVGAGAGQGATVTFPGYAEDVAGVAFERAHHFACRQIDDAHKTIGG